MRTIFVGGQEKPNGVNSYTFNLANELKKNGYVSKVLCYGSCNKEYKFQDVDILQFKTTGGSMQSIPLLYIKTLPYLIKHRKEYDVVMFQTVRFSSIPSFILRLFGKNTCSIVHSLAEDSPKHSKLLKRILHCSMSVALRFTPNIITVSETKAKEIYAKYGQKASVIPCGVNLPEESETDSILSENDIVPNKYFLTIGRFDPIKNLETLIDAFKKHSNKGYQLVIAGDTSSSYAKGLIQRSHDCKSIIFPGMVSGSRKDTLLRNCMAYCLVSSSEGLPIALLEGISYAKVPLVTRIPSIKEVLFDSDVALWSDVQNVDELSMNMDLVQSKYDQLGELGMKSYEIVKNKYTWDKIYDTYISYCNTHYGK